jgi:microcystin-dependent protein
MDSTWKKIICLSVVITVIFIAGNIFKLERAETNDVQAPKKSDLLPVGTTVAWAGDPKLLPKDWRICDGRVLSKEKFPALFEAIGTAWGGDGEPNFSLPDLRGRFLRGVDDGAGRDPDTDKRQAGRQGGNSEGVGSVQEDSLQNHKHLDKGHSHTIHNHGDYLESQTHTPANALLAYWPADETEDSQQGKADLGGAEKFGTKDLIKKGEETRPKNAYVYWIIKVK